jgi:GNAT superfamily N-acetyltransferase
MTLVWREEALGKSHNRKGFDCGEPTLNEYLVRYAWQNHKSGGAKTFVATELANPLQVIGYYSLCPASLEYARTPESLRRGLGKYDVPVFRLGRLAVAKTMQGKGLGGQLLIAAGRRCLTVAEQVGGVALLIDAKNDRAANWYASYGAVVLLDKPLSLLLPFSVIESLFEKR